MEKPNRTDDEQKKIVWRKDILSQVLDVERVAINRWFKGEERNKRCYREYQWGFRKLNKEKHRIDYQGV